MEFKCKCGNQIFVADSEDSIMCVRCGEIIEKSKDLKSIVVDGAKHKVISYDYFANFTKLFKLKVSNKHESFKCDCGNELFYHIYDEKPHRGQYSSAGTCVCTECGNIYANNLFRGKTLLDLERLKVACDAYDLITNSRDSSIGACSQNDTHKGHILFTNHSECLKCSSVKSVTPPIPHLKNGVSLGRVIQYYDPERDIDIDMRDKTEEELQSYCSCPYCGNKVFYEKDGKYECIFCHASLTFDAEHVIDFREYGHYVKHTDDPSVNVILTPPDHIIDEVIENNESLIEYARTTNRDMQIIYMLKDYTDKIKLFCNREVKNHGQF